MTITTRNRTRTISGPTYHDVLYENDRRGNGVFTGGTVQSLLDHSFESMTDQEDSEWMSKKNDGEVVVNPVEHTKTSYRTEGHGRYHWLRGAQQYHEEGPGLTHSKIVSRGSWMQPIPAIPDPSHDMVAAAKLQALSNVDKSPYSFAEDIAEIRETWKFLKDPVGSLRRLERELTRKREKINRIKDAAKKADAIVDLYLQYQFALSPLVRSLNDALTSLIKRDSLPSNRRRARGKTEWSDTASRHGIIQTWESSSWVKKTIEVHAGVIYEHSNPIYDWKWKYGLRFKDIPETLWAITPYSFMVDRLFNISQSARALVAFLDPNVKMLGGWASTKTTTKSRRRWLNHVSSIVTSVTLRQLDDFIEETVHYSRVGWEPAISDVIPPMRLDQVADTATKIADITALTWAAIRRGR